MTGTTEEALDASVIALYRAAREESVASFPDAALELAGRLVPFDYAVWSRAVLESGKVRLYGVHQLRLPEGALAALRRVEHRDVLGAMAFAQLGRTVMASPSRSVTDDPVILKELIEPFDISHVLTTCLVDPFTSLVSSLTLVRKAASPAFTEEMRRLKERITPHLVEALTANLLRSLERRDTGPYPYAGAITDREGVLEFASRDFVNLIRLQWLEWLGPRLPSNFPLPASGSARHVLPEITIRSEVAGRSVWLRVRRRQQVDALSEREADVAHLSALGRSNKEIGKALGLSPFTVRNHLESVYRKLEISKRSELGMLAAEFGAGPDKPVS